jgi:hypothetical protein
MQNFSMRGDTAGAYAELSRGAAIGTNAIKGRATPISLILTTRKLSTA